MYLEFRFSHLANIGDAKSLVIHPASTTHSRMSREDLDKTGISQGLVRFSVGLEDIDDLIADVGQGLAAVRALTATRPEGWICIWSSAFHTWPTSATPNPW